MGFFKYSRNETGRIALYPTFNSICSDHSVKPLRLLLFFTVTFCRTSVLNAKTRKNNGALLFRFYCFISCIQHVIWPRDRIYKVGKPENNTTFIYPVGMAVIYCNFLFCDAFYLLDVAKNTRAQGRVYLFLFAVLFVL